MKKKKVVAPVEKNSAVVLEKWQYGDETGNSVDVFYQQAGVVVAQIVNDNDELTDLDRRRAKLIAKAPEMASLLLRGITQVTHGPKRSEVEAVLRDAGVL